jgi:hypothetical protein
MRELSVVADRDSNVLAHQPGCEEDGQRRPMETKQSRNRPKVEYCDNNEEDPVESARMPLHQLDQFKSLRCFSIRSELGHGIPSLSFRPMAGIARSNVE